MIYGLRHRTTYAYEDPVSFARCVLRLTPRSSPTQTVLETSVTVTPPPSEAAERTDPFGARALTVTVDQPHTRLLIEARSRIDVHVPPPPDPEASPPWEAVRAAAFASRDLGPEGPAAYVYPTRRTPLV